MMMANRPWYEIKYVDWEEWPVRVSEDLTLFYTVMGPEDESPLFCSTAEVIAGVPGAILLP